LAALGLSISGIALAATPVAALWIGVSVMLGRQDSEAGTRHVDMSVGR